MLIFLNSRASDLFGKECAFHLTGVEATRAGLLCAT
jgi:hypothetical protein